MNRFLLFVILLVATVSAHAARSDERNAGVMLQEMSKAIRTLNYEFYYVQLNAQGIDALRYRHVLLNGKTFAQLLRMDGPRVEVRQNKHQISYFQSDLKPFTLSGNYIIDAFPSVVFAHFLTLAQYYNYTFVGQMRMADRKCQIIRVVPKENNRYTYVIWLDDLTKLPVQINLLDLDGQTLEQFKMISFNIGDNLIHLLKEVEKAPVPPLMKLPEQKTVNFDWSPKWLPDGFVNVSSNNRKQPVNRKNFPGSRFYTDGLFSFSINVAPVNRKNNTESTFQKDHRTIQTKVSHNIEITVVGDIPPSTAKRIADNLALKINK